MQQTGQEDNHNLTYEPYESEHQLQYIMDLIATDLSEPYSIYTYRYFLHAWPDLCFLCMSGSLCVGVVVCKLDYHRDTRQRGYIAMLAVKNDYRKQGIGSKLVKLALSAMKAKGADEVVLETELSNNSAQKLYENLGFLKDKRMTRYYLNGSDAYRLKLWLKA